MQQLSYPHLCALVGRTPSRLSQAMHNAGYQALGIPFVYVAFDTTDTSAVFRACRNLGFRGLSLTIPHKEKAFSLVDELDEDARKIGAINTVLNEKGKLIGYNTDCFGIEKALEEAGVEVSGKHVLIIGAGGASRAALYALKKQKAGSVVLANRSEDRGRKLAAEFQVTFCPFSKLKGMSLADIDIIVNATPIENGFPISPLNLTEKHCVFDFITKRTPLTAEASSRGAQVILGTRMLFFQAVKQFELFTGSAAPTAQMEAALTGSLVNRELLG